MARAAGPPRRPTRPGRSAGASRAARRAVTARVAAGRVVTYRQVAAALGTKAYRAVGNALNRNPYAPAVPCHRVVGADGSLTGFAGGLEKKRRLLAGEGVRLRPDGRVD